MFKKIILISFIFFSGLLTGCTQKTDENSLQVATSAEYPPFEYQEKGEIKGFDIDLARLIAGRLGKQAVFHNMQFSSILPALTSGQVDVAISTITITDERKKNFDFSHPYYFEGIAVVFKNDAPIKQASQLKGKKVAVQLGTTMEIWLKEKFPGQPITSLNYNNQAIEALKAGHVDAVVLDGSQGAVFSEKNQGLGYAIITESKDGYGLALKKDSPLTAKINVVLKQLEAEGEIEKLKKKWLK